MKTNLIMQADSYKYSHWVQYPENTTYLFDYLESRGGKYPSTLFFGLQYILKQYFTTPITKEDVEEAKVFMELHGEPFNYDGWMYIVNEHNGYLPIRIKAIPEGTVVPTKNVLLTVESTDPKVFWVASFVETMILRVWYPITVATQSFFIKQTILDYLFKTADDPLSAINFMLHDFGARGVSSEESAMIGGAAHLVNFMGSDTVTGIRCANHFYKHPMAAFSIPAAEHSTITSWGREGESAAYRNMLKQYAKPGSLVAIVSDSYDLFNAVENIWGNELKQEVIDSGATVVIRPDSGDPATMVLKTLKLLDKQFGSTLNSKGYKVLNHVKVIQGDGINHNSIVDILDTAVTAGFSVSNLAFGMGGALLQQIDRDTQKFAIKCSAAEINGKLVDVFKQPATDPGKGSKKGKLTLVKDGSSFKTVKESEVVGQSELIPVFENGKVLKEYTLDEVRERANSFLNTKELLNV